MVIYSISMGFTNEHWKTIQSMVFDDVLLAKIWRLHETRDTRVDPCENGEA